MEGMEVLIRKGIGLLIMKGMGILIMKRVIEYERNRVID